MKQRVAGQGEYVRVQERHALPHIYHPDDFCKLLPTCRVAASMLRAEKLPSRLVLSVLETKAGDGIEWHRDMRPPPISTCDIFDTLFSCALRCGGMMQLVSLAPLLRGVDN